MRLGLPVLVRTDSQASLSSVAMQPRSQQENPARTINLMQTIRPVRWLASVCFAASIVVAMALHGRALPPNDAPPENALAPTAEATELIQAWVGDLASAEYAVRREAFMKLWQQGARALPAVRHAATVNDQQTVSAARALELLLKYEISPQDNDELAELLQLSRGGLNRALISLSEKGHWKLATELLRNNEPILATFRDNVRPDGLCMILQAASNQGGAEKAWPVIQLLLKPAQRLWIAERTGAKLNASETEPSVDDRALALLFRGEGDKAWELNPSVLVKHRILFLTGSWERLKEPSLESRLLGIKTDTRVGRAQQAAYAYLANDLKASDELLKKVREDLSSGEGSEPSPPPAPANPGQRLQRGQGAESQAERRTYELVMALLICGDGEAVHQLLSSDKQPEPLTYHAGRLEYEKVLADFGLDTELSNFDEWLKEALAKTKPAPAQASGRGGPPEFKRFCSLASFLVSLGRSEEGLKLYKALIEQAQGVSLVMREQFWDELAQQTSQPQLRSRLIEHLDAQGAEVPVEVRERLLTKLYPEWVYITSALWKFAPAELTTNINPGKREGDGASTDPASTDPASKDSASAGQAGKERAEEAGAIDDKPIERRWATIERLWCYDRTLVSQSRDSRALEDWLTNAFRDSAKMEENAGAVGSQMSEIALQLGLRRLALSFANSGAGRTPFAVVAEICMKSSQYEVATSWWDLAIRQDPRQHKWILRNAAACSMVGDDEKAQQLESSRWMRPLLVDQGDLSYSSIAKEFYEAGDLNRAREYGEAAFSLFDPASQLLLGTAATYGEILRDLEDFKKFADVHRAGIVTLLMHRNEVYSVSTLQYFVTHEFLARAVAELDEGDVESALERIRRYESLRPSGIEICEFTYGRLVKLGRKDAANEMLERCGSRMVQHLEKWPRDAGSHNNLAWMYARCNQRLDDALKHAELAVKLSDRAPTYLDTLAEVHFKLGHVPTAVELTKEAISRDPRHAHYRKQLQRFREALL